MNWADEKYTPGGDVEKADMLDAVVAAGGRIHSSRKHGWWDDEVSVFCPFCSDASSRKPAGRVNTTKQMYHCWSCGFGAKSPMTIAMRFLETEDKDVAKRWLDEVVGSAQ